MVCEVEMLNLSKLPKTMAIFLRCNSMSVDIIKVLTNVMYRKGSTAFKNFTDVFWLYASSQL